MNISDSPKCYFVTAIGTDSGKTLISAILTEALKADYWKPVQSGIEETDKETVKTLVSNQDTTFFDEAYLLKSPESPHSSAKKDGVKISMENIVLPKSQNKNLVIEGAGGMLVPLNEKDLVIDLAEKFNCEIILVSNIYLGSINHTLLTVNELKKRGLKVIGLIFNGQENKEAQDYILSYSGYEELLYIPKLNEVNSEAVKKYAEKLKTKL